MIRLALAPAVGEFFSCVQTPLRATICRFYLQLVLLDVIQASDILNEWLALITTKMEFAALRRGRRFRFGEIQFKINGDNVIMMDSFQLVTRGLAQRLGLDASKITLEDELLTLGIDSLDAAELLMELEDKLGVEIEQARKLKTVGDIVAAIDEATD